MLLWSLPSVRNLNLPVIYADYVSSFVEITSGLLY